MLSIAPPSQEYIRQLVLVRLNKNTVSEVAKKLLKVPWAENERYILKCMLKVLYTGRRTPLPILTPPRGSALCTKKL